MITGALALNVAGIGTQAQEMVVDETRLPEGPGKYVFLLDGRIEAEFVGALDV